jgi:hypothetical protein
MHVDKEPAVRTENRNTAARRRAGAVRLPVERNPDASWPVTVYRGVLPVRARRGLARLVSQGTRARTKRLLSGWGEGGGLTALRDDAATRRLPSPVFGEDRVIGRVRGVPKVFLTAPAPTPFEARQHNLEAVCAALEEARIDHFCVRGQRDAHSVVAVAAADGPAVRVALAALCHELPGYVSVMDGRSGPPGESAPGFTPATWKRAAGAAVIRLTWYHSDPRGRLVMGTRYGCDVEFWDDEDGCLVAPRPNPIADRVPAGTRTVRVSASALTRLRAPTAVPLPPVRTRPEFAAPRPDDIAFPVDVVYTWVDGMDPEWARKRQRYGGGDPAAVYHEEAANTARFASRDELRYSLRSIHQHAPWVRNVLLVTDDQVPAWLDTAAPGLRVVSHREIFRDPSVLPTFNSHAIESQLHRMDGLSEHFLYFNDDVFLGRLTTPQEFFHANGLTKYFPSPALIPVGGTDPGDVPVSAAGKNNRSVLEEHFSTVITQKMKHTPHPLRRSVLAEIEERFEERHRATAASRFRSLTDLSIASSLHHYYAYQTARAVPGRVTYAYLDLSHPQTPARLARLLSRRDRQVFCINDTVSTDDDVAGQESVLRPFLEAYFPVPSPYELHD